MSDIYTRWSNSLQMGDWSIIGADIESGDDVVTATLISLFTDRLANQDDVIPDGTDDPRGWVGDLDQQVLIGSRLWLLSRSVLTQEVANTSKDMAAEALQWLIDDGVVVKIEVSTEIVLPNRLNMKVVLYRNDGTRTAMNFTNSWPGVK